MFGIKMDLDIWMTLVFVIIAGIFVLLESFLLWRRKSLKLLMSVLLGFIAIQSVWLLIFLWVMGEYGKMVMPAIIMITGPAYWLYLVLTRRGDKIITIRTIDQPMKSFRLAFNWRKKKP
ncbi:MAG: hypothetical protein FWD61_10480 [Phycisphaerales bacterium]|nr:hypothetical protein [Phycisphaerales bacterium]